MLGMPLSPEYCTKITELFNESKTVVGVRAISTVTLVKLKEKIEASKDAAKSKAAIVRETRRLIAALEVTLPGALWTYLDEAAATT